MSHYDPPSAYNSKFRALIMHLFMDDLGIEQIEKYWFLGDLPERLKDDPNKARCETLTYVQHEGLLEEWAEKPRILQRILEEIGRTDLSTKVQKLVDQAPGDDLQSKVEDLDYTVDRSGMASPVVVCPRPRKSAQKKKIIGTSSSRQLEALCLEDEPVPRSRLSSDASARSSGYWSIRYSDARLSQISIPESVDEEDESNEESPSNLVKKLQSTAIEEDEGVMDINRIEWSDMEPMHRPRAVQVSKTWQSNRKVECSDHSQTLPYSSRSVQGAAMASSHTKSDSMSSSDSSSSSSSLDSNDTLTSGLPFLPNLKPYPVVSRVNISGSMKIKVKNILKSAKKNSQVPMISEEFPPPNGYEGPRYEMRFYPSDFSKECTSLYINLTQPYLSRKQHSTIEIPAMDITVTVTYVDESVGGWSSIKTVTDRTMKRKIDSKNRSEMTTQIARFPHLLSHAELKLNKSKGRKVVVSVNMNVY